MAYNFNPREKVRRTMKFDEYERLGMIKWSMVPIGRVEVNQKYLSPCSVAYRAYNECLRKTLFDKDECKGQLEEVQMCERSKGLFEMEKKLEILKSFKKRKPKAEHESEVHEHGAEVHQQDE